MQPSHCVIHRRRGAPSTLVPRQDPRVADVPRRPSRDFGAPVVIHVAPVAALSPSRANVVRFLLSVDTRRIIVGFLHRIDLYRLQFATRAVHAVMAPALRLPVDAAHRQAREDAEAHARLRINVGLAAGRLSRAVVRLRHARDRRDLLLGMQCFGDDDPQSGEYDPHGLPRLMALVDPPGAGRLLRLRRELLCAVAERPVDPAWIQRQMGDPGGQLVWDLGGGRNARDRLATRYRQFAERVRDKLLAALDDWLGGSTASRSIAGLRYPALRSLTQDKLLAARAAWAAQREQLVVLAHAEEQHDERSANLRAWERALRDHEPNGPQARTASIPADMIDVLAPGWSERLGELHACAHALRNGVVLDAERIVAALEGSGCYAPERVEVIMARHRAGTARRGIIEELEFAATRLARMPQERLDAMALSRLKAQVGADPLPHGPTPSEELKK